MAYAMDGQDAFDLAGKVIPVIQNGDTKEQQNFKLKQQVLVVLTDPISQRLLRSVLYNFKRLRSHHNDYTLASTSPSDCLEFHLLWSDQERWIADMVVPSLRDGLCSLETVER